MTKWISILTLLLASGCASTESMKDGQVTDSREEQTFVIGGGRPSAKNEGSVADLNHHAKMAIAPAGTLRISKVSRPRAEMREGPGINFALTDRILEEGSPVIVFEQHGVWVKVISMANWEGGWIHGQTITQPKLNKKSVAVNLSMFPTVLAVKPVSEAMKFASNESVQLREAIPRGKMFRALQVTNEKTLIWMPESNAIFWIAGKDMQ